MIATASPEVHVTSTLTGKRVAMTLAQNAGPKVMSILTRLYEDPLMAVIREYSTNARDAVIEAGSDRPIEVTLPSRFEPLLKIRDHGVGMSAADIENIYSQYANSTKENTNEQTGMLGLGCKSALAYCDQFTVTSVKDGRRIQVAVSRDDDNGGSMTIVDEHATTDPNGTEIAIPTNVTDALNCQYKSAHLFSFWDEGTVLVNGEQPKRVDGLWLTDNMLLTKGLNKDYVVMGGVPYPIAIGHGMRDGNHLVVWVPIGTVDFSPDRESLEKTSHTNAALEEIKEVFIESVVDAIQESINGASDHLDAVKIMLQWHRTVPDTLRPAAGHYTYKNDPLPLRMEAPSADEPFILVKANYNKLKDHSKIESYGAESWADSWWIHGFNRADWTPTMRKKLNHYMEIEHNLSYMYSERFVITQTKIKSPFIRIERRIKWADIEAVKLPRTVGAQRGENGRIPGSYDIYDGGVSQYGTPGDDIDTSRPLFWFNGRLGDYDGRRVRDLFEVEYPDATIVALNSNRVNKFLRNFPNAKHTSEGVSEAWDRFEATITDDEKKTLAARRSYDRSFLDRLDKTRIDDPAIIEAINHNGVDVTRIENAIDRFRHVVSANIKLPTLVNPITRTKYPLLFDYYGDLRVRHSSDTDRRWDHVHMYINAVYAADLDNST